MEYIKEYTIFDQLYKENKSVIIRRRSLKEESGWYFEEQFGMSERERRKNDTTLIVQVVKTVATISTQGFMFIQQKSTLFQFGGERKRGIDEYAERAVTAIPSTMKNMMLVYIITQRGRGYLDRDVLLLKV